MPSAASRRHSTRGFQAPLNQGAISRPSRLSHMLERARAIQIREQSRGHLGYLTCSSAPEPSTSARRNSVSILPSSNMPYSASRRASPLKGAVGSVSGNGGAAASSMRANFLRLEGHRVGVPTPPTPPPVPPPPVPPPPAVPGLAGGEPPGSAGTAVATTGAGGR